MKKILIQLIGEQTLPNIFPILSICPDRVVNIYTQTTAKENIKIIDWCRKYGEKYGARPKFTKSAPIGESLSETQKGIADILRKELAKVEDASSAMLILNMTGGTKAMSASAISYCMQISNIRKEQGLNPVPIFYLNPSAREMEFVTCEELRDKVLVRSPLDIRLSVQEIIEAGGNTVVVSYNKNWEKVYPAAKKLRDLADEDILFTLNESRNYKDYDVRRPLSLLLKDNNTNRLVQRVNALKNLAAVAEKDDAVLQGFRLCGLDARDSDFYFTEEICRKVEDILSRIDNQGMKKHQKYNLEREARHMLTGAANFLVGGWWEVMVAHAYQQENPQAQVLWSVETADKHDHKHAVETDIIASDGLSLCCISCKRGLHASVMQELEQHCARTTMLAGLRHRRIIAVFRRDALYELRSLSNALKLEMWDAKKVKCIEEGKPYEKKEAPTAERRGKSQEEDAKPERIPFFKRVASAIRILFSGKGRAS